MKNYLHISQSPTSLKSAWLALLGLSAVFLFEMLDNSILNVALPTIGKELNASISSLGWVTSSYSIAFGSLMLIFGLVADRYGRKRLMLIGLVLLLVSGLLIVFVHSIAGLIAIRILMGIAAAMTTPLSLALAFRLFSDDSLRVRAMSLISTVGLVGLAIGPTVSGLVLAFAPWETLIIMNSPIALLALISLLLGIPSDSREELHSNPIDILGALLGAISIVGFLLSVNFLSNYNLNSLRFWIVIFATILSASLFFVRAKKTAFPVIHLNLIKLPLVSSGLLYKISAGMVTAIVGYIATFQLQQEYGWSPTAAALGLLPQIVALFVTGFFVNKLSEKFGFKALAWASSILIVIGLATYILSNSLGYIWIAISLVLIAMGVRVNGVISGTNVFRGLPKEHTSIGSALVDTSSQLASSIGIIITSSAIAVFFKGNFSSVGWNSVEIQSFHFSINIAGTIVLVLATAFTTWGIYCASKKPLEISLKK